jgi:hypothetical protein
MRSLLRQVGRSLAAACVLLGIGGTMSAEAQPWLGILDPSRAIDWSRPGVEGGIQTRTQVCQTIAPYTGTAAVINTAIANCPAGQVVMLGAGIFTLSSGITFGGKSNVTLRGAGPDATFIFANGNVSCVFTAAICIRGTTQLYGGDVNSIPSNQQTAWTGGFAKGSTQLTVASTAGMGVGQILVLDQLDDSVDTGGIVNSSIVPTFANEGGPPGRHDTADGGVFRSQMQFVKVVSVDNSTDVTITPPVYMPNWRSAQAPEVWWWGNAATTAQFNGIEDLSIDGAGCGTNCTYNIGISNAYNNWVRNVRSLHSNRGFVGMVQSARNEVRDSYVYGSPGAAVSYGTDNFATGDNLVINNIFQHNATPTQGPSPGYVFAYNFMTDMYFSPGTFNFHAIFASHDSGGGMELFEGNQTNGFITDYPHGNSPLMTVFRNHLKGRDDVPRSQNEIVFEMRPWGRAHNVVGNVLGLTGFHNLYEAYPGGPSPNGRNIYQLGFGGSGVPNDRMVRSSLLRWGNWDAVTGTRWDASEIPTAAITFINGNAVPNSQTLPASFFLSLPPTTWWATPWGTPSWPPIGPDVTGGTMPNAGGHAYKIPARLCYENSPADTRYPVDPSGLRPLLFNANACYQGAGSASAPSPPKNLSVQ